jgi:hypothetical protein
VCQWLISVILATQGDCGSKPAWANSSQDPISKKKKKNQHKKRGGGVAQGGDPELKSQSFKKKEFSKM